MGLFATKGGRLEDPLSCESDIGSMEDPGRSLVIMDGTNDVGAVL